MATQSLVVSRDPEILGVLGHLMQEAGMDVDVCSEMPGAMRSLRENKYDTVIVDCDQDQDGFDLLVKLRQDEGNKKMVAVGITSDVASNQTAFASGATFVLNKPLPVEDARRILRISKGVMTRAVRRFLRLPVDGLAIASLDDRLEGVMLNISQRGLCVQTTETLNTAQMVYVAFLLPDTFELIEGACQVMWVDPSGRAGLEFRSLDDRGQEELTKWVFERARRINPDLKAPETLKGFEITEEIPEEHFSLPGRPIAIKAIGIGVDALVVAFGTALFFTFGALVGFPIVGPGPLLTAWFAGVVFWGVYRFLFDFFRVESVGKKAEDKVLERL
ncbi:MAG: response regulator [Acidobacteriales bacterium]|nr:response regulator [Terriglobales bacterium]